MFLVLICTALVAVGAAIQVAVGAGLSVVCGASLFLWLGPMAAVPILLLLNLLVSVVATALGGTRLRWGDVWMVSGAILLGCAGAALVPPLPDTVLKAVTATILILAALPRPAAHGPSPAAPGAWTGVACAGVVTGMLTLWTASPGPVTPVALARWGRSGDEVRRVMQPVSIVGYGIALAITGLPGTAATGPAVLVGLIAAAIVGTGCGIVLRSRLKPASVVVLIRVIALLAAALLLLSLVF